MIYKVFNLTFGGGGLSSFSLHMLMPRTLKSHKALEYSLAVVETQYYFFIFSFF